MSERRRPTRDIERLLGVAKENYDKLRRSRRYAEMSAYRNKGRWLETIRDCEVAGATVILILDWILGNGLTEEQKKQRLSELEPAMDTHDATPD